MEPLEERQLLAVLTWDPDGLNNGQFGGSGNWTATDAWVDTGSNARYTWDSSRSGDSAVFLGDSGTVTVDSAGINAVSLTFESGGYTLGSNALTLTGNGVALTAAESASIDSGISVAIGQQWNVASEKTLTISGNIDLAGHALTIGGAGNTYLTGVVSGTNSDLTKTGTGALTLSGANTYDHGATISQGSVSFAAGSLGTSGTISMTGGAVTLQWSSGNTDDLSDRLSIQAGATVTLDVGGNSVEFADPIENDAQNLGSLTKAGTGLLSLTGNDRFSSVAISAGTVEVRGEDISTLGYGDINNDGTLVFNCDGNLNVGGAISGDGEVIQQGEGTLIFTGTNTYSGGTTISGGTLLVGASGSAATSYTLTARLSAGISGETVTFLDDTASTIIGTAVTNASGIATLTYVIMESAAPGPHTIRAVCGASSLTGTLSVEAVAISQWLYRKQLTISNANVDADLVDFPLYVKISNDADIGSAALATGYDVRFTAADGTTLLDYERESWSGGGGQAANGTFWVKVPVVSHSSTTTIYVYYGKPDAADGQNPSGVWGTDFRGVWHFGATTLSAQDSTCYQNDAATTSVTPPTTTMGVISGAAAFNGSQYMQAANDSSLQITGQITLGAWVKITTADSSWRRIFDKAYNNGYVLAITGSSPYGKGAVVVGNGQTSSTLTSPSTLANGSWHFLVGTYDGSTEKVYVDGALVSSGAYAGGIGSDRKEPIDECQQRRLDWQHR